MTSDIVQNTYISRERNRLPEKALSSRRFLGSQKEIFGYAQKESSATSEIIANTNKAEPAPIEKEALEQSPVKKDAVDKTALLKTAYKMLRQVERELALKEERIQALQEILTVDELTGLTNRRGFYRAFEGELDRTNRGENQGGLLIMVDLDRFKQINDTYGHLAGDMALKTVGEFLRNTTRPMDVVARLGGDEFILLMPNANIGKAIKRARKIGNALNDLSFEWKDETIGIHASLGLKEYTQGDTIESIIEQADNGLYQDKKMRRDAMQAAE